MRKSLPELHNYIQKSQTVKTVVIHRKSVEPTYEEYIDRTPGPAKLYGLGKKTRPLPYVGYSIVNPSDSHDTSHNSTPLSKYSGMNS